MAQAAPMPMCPMAETCRGMMERPLSGLIMLVPGITFIALGMLIIVWPSILPWLMGRRVHPGRRRHALDGQLHARGRRPAAQRSRLARNSYPCAAS
jgi:hypothetical protein